MFFGHKKNYWMRKFLKYLTFFFSLLLVYFYSIYHIDKNTGRRRVEKVEMFCNYTRQFDIQDLLKFIACRRKKNYHLLVFFILFYLHKVEWIVKMKQEKENRAIKSLSTISDSNQYSHALYFLIEFLRDSF